MRGSRDSSRVQAIAQLEAIDQEALHAEREAGQESMKPRGGFGCHGLWGFRASEREETHS